MPAVERILERNYGESVERGHCKCCCGKWSAVKRPRRRPSLRRVSVPKYELVWVPRTRCTCQTSHKPAA
ncbi:MAG: hypothetical protein V3R16_02555 [Nitrospirales bacterium]